MKVWMVEFVEDYACGHVESEILGIFTDKSMAVKEADKYMKEEDLDYYSINSYILDEKLI